MRVFFFSVMVCLATQISVAQQVKRFTVQPAGSVVLRDVEDKYSPSIFSVEMPEPDGRVEYNQLRQIKTQVAAMYPHRSGNVARKTSSSLNAPIVGINFVADSNAGIPPDNYSAVRPFDKTVNVMNSTIAVHDANTGSMLLRKSLYSLSLSVGLPYSITNPNVNFRFDPKVVYDPVADRYICTILCGENSGNWVLLGFTQTSDPTGVWNFYKLYGDYAANSTWFDYPAIAITQNEFFLTGNKIMYDSSWQAGFTRSVIYQVRKQDGYDSSALTYRIWDSIQYNGKFLRCLYPLNPGDNVSGPAQYFLSNRNFDISNDSVFIVKVPDTIGSTDTVITVTPVTSSTTYGAPPDGRQPDTSLSLATNDGRVLGGFIQGSQMQFVSTTSNPANGTSAIFHGVIDNFSTTPVMHAQIYSIDTLDFGYPNISYAGTPGQSIISFDFTGPNTYPGFGAVLSDGTAYSDMVILKAGDSTIDQYPGKEQRWGDYSGTQPQWGTPGTVWVEGIYGRRKGRSYGNYMAQLVSPYHVGVQAVHPVPANSKLYPNPVIAMVTFEFNVSEEQTFSFYIYDIQGRLVDKIMDNFCAEGKNIIQFNTASLKPGTYLLKAIGRKGENISIHEFVRE